MAGCTLPGFGGSICDATPITLGQALAIGQPRAEAWQSDAFPWTADFYDGKSYGDAAADGTIDGAAITWLIQYYSPSTSGRLLLDFKGETIDHVGDLGTGGFADGYPDIRGAALDSDAVLSRLRQDSTFNAAADRADVSLQGTVQGSTNNPIVWSIELIDAGGTFLQHNLNEETGDVQMMTAGTWPAVTGVPDPMAACNGSPAPAEDDEEELTEEDFDVLPKPNTYTIEGEGGKKRATFVNVYLEEEFTSNGQHYRNNEGQTISWFPRLVDSGKEKWEGFKDWFKFWEKEHKDPDQELLREITSEVISKHKKDNDVQKAYEKVGERLADAAGEAVPKYFSQLVSVPADTILIINEEAQLDNWFAGVQAYVGYRTTEYNSPDAVYDNVDESFLVADGRGVSGGEKTQVPKSVLIARYEEIYQKWNLAKDLGRTA